MLEASVQFNPLSVALYRERNTLARTRSDHVDTMMLGDILRVDAARHRPLPTDTELVHAIAVLAAHTAQCCASTSRPR